MKNYFNDWENYFIVYRPYLMSFAFRMTGSLSVAEDIVQDTFLECADINPAEIKNPKSWLTKVCSNKSLDHLKRAYKKREAYPGVWLPDTVPDSYQFWGSLTDDDSPDKNLTNNESLTTSFLLMMQQMSGEERVVYILNEVFDYTFKEIAEFLNKSEDASKKIAQRARKTLETLSRYKGYDEAAMSVVHKFFDVMKNGSADSLLEILAPDSELWADGGGKASVVSTEVVRDSARIAKFFSALGKAPIFSSDKFRVEFKVVNSRPGIVVSKSTMNGWIFDTILNFEVVDGLISRVYAQRNPDKFEKL